MPKPPRIIEALELERRARAAHKRGNPILAERYLRLAAHSRNEQDRINQMQKECQCQQ